MARISPEDRLILALDVDDSDQARRTVEALGDAVRFYKVGLQLFLGGGGFSVTDWLRAAGKKVFLDLKFYDVPRTVGAAVGRVRGRGVSLLTVHGDAGILEAACAALAPPEPAEAPPDPADGRGTDRGEALPGILAITVLTSLEAADLRELGFAGDMADLVVMRARRAVEAGCVGVVASGREVGPLRSGLGEEPLLVVPGIRDAPAGLRDDQKRTVTVEEALRLGADHVVVGRPIRGAPDPKAAALQYQERIAACL